jgi:VanZ family protein
MSGRFSLIRRLDLIGRRRSTQRPTTENLLIDSGASIMPAFSPELLSFSIARVFAIATAGREASLTVAQPKQIGTRVRGTKPAEPFAGFSGLWAIVVAAGILYGSLIPFEFTTPRLQLSDLFRFAHLTWQPGALEDHLTNLLIYVPLGAVVVWTRGLARRGIGIRLVCAGGIGMLLSLLAETLQVGIAGRVSSWTDVVLNSLGCCAGALLGAMLEPAARRTLLHVRSRMALAPMQTIAAALGLALVAWSLAPYDFVHSTGGLYAAFHRAEWDVLSFQAATADTEWTPITAMVAGASWFGLLGYFAALAGRESHRHRVAALLLALQGVLIFAIVIEVMQLFTQSHVFSVPEFILHGVAGLIGAWVAMFIVDGPTLSVRRNPFKMAVPTSMLVVALLAQVVFLLAPSLTKAASAWPAVHLAGVGRLPFEGLWRGSMSLAAMEIASLTLQCGLLALTIAVLLRREGWSRPWLPVGVFVIVITLLAEAIRATAAPTGLDLTSPILALVAAIAVARVYPAFRRLVIPE